MIRVYLLLRLCLVGEGGAQNNQVEDKPVKE